MDFSYLLKYRHGDRNSNLIAVTFDDGPSFYTEKVLDILAKYQIKATFFMIAENIEQLPEITKRVIDEGHEIGGHLAQSKNFSWIRAFFKKLDPNRIKKMQELFVKNLGFEPVLFRPSPEVAVNKHTGTILKKFKLIPILASAYSRVHKPKNVQIREITKKLRGGDIILLHDGHDNFLDSTRPKITPEILLAIINVAKDKGLKFCTVSQLLKMNHALHLRQATKE